MCRAICTRFDFLGSEAKELAFSMTQKWNLAHAPAGGPVPASAPAGPLKHYCNCRFQPGSVGFNDFTSRVKEM